MPKADGDNVRTVRAVGMGQAQSTQVMLLSHPVGADVDGLIAG
jgi:hypothetical protein